MNTSEAIALTRLNVKPSESGAVPIRPSLSLRVPSVIEAGDLAGMNKRDDILIVDLRSSDRRVGEYIPGAVLLPYENLVRSDGKAEGLEPEIESLLAVLSAIGLRDESWVIAYDDDNGTRASRLLWLLNAIGHRTYSLLNGGFSAWRDGNYPLVAESAEPQSTDYYAAYKPEAFADRAYVRRNLNNPDVILLDARSAPEFDGSDIRATRGGHIPGAINFEWSLAVDVADYGRLREPAVIARQLRERGITPDREIVVYCQTHHRSSLSFIALKHAGYTRVRAYPGSWSEWGNRRDTPIAIAEEAVPQLAVAS
ncbi:MAG: sulfurtransferase [Pseudomonadota bacterium]